MGFLCRRLTCWSIMIGSIKVSVSNKKNYRRKRKVVFNYNIDEIINSTLRYYLCKFVKRAYIYNLPPKKQHPIQIQLRHESRQITSNPPRLLANSIVRLRFHNARSYRTTVRGARLQTTLFRIGLRCACGYGSRAVSRQTANGNRICGQSFSMTGLHVWLSLSFGIPIFANRLRNQKYFRSEFI